MKKSKKQLTLLLCIIISLALVFTACKAEDEKQPSSSTEPDSSVKTEDATADNTSEEKVHRLRIMGPSSTNFVNWEEREEFESWKLFQEHLKERNIELEFEWIVPEQYPTVIQTRMASALDLPDIANISPLDDMTAMNLGFIGTIIDINSAIEQYSDGSINKKFEEGGLNFSKQLNTAPDGKRYWFSTAIASGSVILDNGNVVENLEVINNAIRKDWLDELGLPIPETVDEWKNALRAFRENDMNGNGVEDEILLFDSYSYSFFTGIAQWFGLVPDIVGFDPNSGKVVSPWYQEGVKDYFKLMNELAKEGIFDVNLVGATDEVCNQKIAENKVSALRSYAIASWFEDLVEGDDDAEYVILSPLTAKEGITPLMLVDSPNLTFDKFAITSACKDVEGAIKLFDYICSDDFNRVCYLGVEGIDYELVEKDGVTVAEPLNKTLTAQEKYEKRIGPMGIFVNNLVFPRIIGRKADAEVSTAQEILDSLPNDKSRRGTQRRFDIMEYRPYVTSPFSSTTYALPSEEELEIINKYYTVLKTYSEELSMGLILGNESLEDWDKHIETLKELGLDEIIEVYAARYQRYKDAIK